MSKIFVIVELPLKEIFYVDMNKLWRLDNEIAKDYYLAIKDALVLDYCEFEVPDSIALSCGGYHKMRDALLDLEERCADKVIIVNVEMDEDSIYDQNEVAIDQLPTPAIKGQNLI